MICLSLSTEALEQHILNCLSIYFPIEIKHSAHNFRLLLTKALDRVEFCFKHIYRKYYIENGKIIFNHLNSDHMTTLLYLLANTIWRETNDEELPTCLFYLNKIMHGIDLFYSVEMPEIFMFVHPLGTVLGKANYQNFLVVYQNVTVGAVDTVYPDFGEGVILYSKTSVLGDSKIGENVIFSANSFVINTNIPNGQTVLGQFPRHRIIENHNSVRNFFEKEK